MSCEHCPHCQQESEARAEYFARRREERDAERRRLGLGPEPPVTVQSVVAVMKSAWMDK